MTINKNDFSKLAKLLKERFGEPFCTKGLVNINESVDEEYGELIGINIGITDLVFDRNLQLIDAGSWQCAESKAKLAEVVKYIAENIQ